MSTNQVNVDDIEQVTRLARRMPTARAVSFNFHTPYPGTEHLTLSRTQRRDCCERIAGLIAEGYPIFNLASVLPRIAEDSAPTPCHQCVVMEDGQRVGRHLVGAHREALLQVAQEDAGQVVVELDVDDQIHVHEVEPGGGGPRSGLPRRREAAPDGTAPRLRTTAPRC